MSFRLAGIGELLWDLLLDGPKLGGAPANFAYHAHALGARSHVITRVGSDELGRKALARLADLGMSNECVEVDDAAPTGTASVELGADGQPHFIIHQNVAWDRLQGEAASRRVVAAADAVCFGTLAQRSANSAAVVQSLVAATPAGALRIFDVNLRQQFYSPAVVEDSLALANVLKVNETELPVLAKIFNLSGDASQQIAALAERHQLRAVALTRGEHGSLLYAAGQWSAHPGIPTQVVDAVGAGDSFTAAMALGLLGGWELDLINQRANEVASYVASCAGATPPLPGPLQSLFSMPCRSGV
jgi:fructokinase